MWPTEVEELISAQRTLADASPEPWRPPERALLVGGVWVCFPRGLTGPGGAGDPAWVAAVVLRRGRIAASHVERTAAAASYVPGLLALRAGALLEHAVRALPTRPDVLLLDATGRDHPRRCGLAVHLGAVLDMATVGVTHRPLRGVGDWPADEPRATAPLVLDDEVVACWLRTRGGTRPLVIHPGWRTDLDTSQQVLEVALAGRRTPEPLRQARRLARRARSADQEL